MRGRLPTSSGVNRRFHALEVIRAATLSGAELLGRDHELGSIEVGKLADLAVVAGNPLAPRISARFGKYQRRMPRSRSAPDRPQSRCSPATSETAG
ncbi:MAG: amidohydrolase family protein [Pseudonocardia sp.]